jgi:hypothetical protein
MLTKCGGIIHQGTEVLPMCFEISPVYLHPCLYRSMDAERFDFKNRTIKK